MLGAKNVILHKNQILFPFSRPMQSFLLHFRVFVVADEK
jgi:hypothetical protein